ncbi:hypothetical protein ACFX16_025805 [Malus domestica]
MAANKFATMLHRNTPKLIVILVYAVLEWILIALLLLNSLLSYLITKFADYFGLKQPCPLCTCRINRVLEQGNSSNNSYTDVVCESHATKISNMFSLPCSPPSEPSWGSLEYARKGDSAVEAADDGNNGGEYQSANKPDSLSTHSDNGYELETTNEEHEDDRVADEQQLTSDVCSSSFRGGAVEDCLRSRSVLLCQKNDADEDNKGGSLEIVRSDSNSSNLVHQSSDASATSIQCCFEEDYSLEIIPLSSENGLIGAHNHRLIPVELIDFSTTVDQGIRNVKEEEVREHDHHEVNFASDSYIGSRPQLSGEASLVLMVNESAVNTSNGEVESLDMARGFTGNSSEVDAEEGKQDLLGKPCDEVVTDPGAQTLFVRIEEPVNKEQNDPPASEEESISVDHIIPRNLASTEVGDRETDHPRAQEGSSSTCFEIPNVPDTFSDQSEYGLRHTEEGIPKEETSKLENDQESEEEKIPNSPTSVNSLCSLHKKPGEKKEPAVEEYLDGSGVSEMEDGDPFTTIGRLKEALTAERKAISSLYAELEQERSASAIAANQTMAMITRLQEEKAAMQMEALQYQRMMEEQSEYDQDALQLLNDLMNKKEKEKQELERELEIYQKKVLDYEEKEKIRIMSRIKYGSVKSRNSSASCSQSWDSDALSIDLNVEARDEESGFGGLQESNNNNNTTDDAGLSLEDLALDCVKNMSVLDESLAGFEEERLSILDQLKALEEKLITLGANEELGDDFKLAEHSPAYSLKDFEENHDFSSPEENGTSNGFSEDKHHPEGKTLGSMVKRLLPLLDATDNETEEGLTHEEHIDRSESIETMRNSITNFELNDGKIAIEEEVDHVYERLQALEADREFLKHCMSSIKKGDKGVDLLQEILQHLRDLRAVELRVKNTNDPEGDEVAVD